MAEKTPHLLFDGGVEDAVHIGVYVFAPVVSCHRHIIAILAERRGHGLADAGQPRRECQAEALDHAACVCGHTCKRTSSMSHANLTHGRTPSVPKQTCKASLHADRLDHEIPPICPVLPK